MKAGEHQPSLGELVKQVLGRLDEVEQAEPEALTHARTQLGIAIERLRAIPGAPSKGQAARDQPSSQVLARLATRTPKASRYRIGHEIARGGMGAILEVWDEDLRRALAMKVALEKDPGPVDADAPHLDSRSLARFIEEAQVTGQLDHPGIVPVHELGLGADGRLYFTMRLVRGRDLAAIFALARTNEEGWTRTRVLGVLLRVCEALGYAHEKGVIHRDLKPANVMVGRFGEVYVMDWGLARVCDRKDSHDLRPCDPSGASSIELQTIRSDERELTPETPLLTADGTVLGTPAYMSPEQARGETEHMDARSDVFALGAMLYHLLCGRAPYHDGKARLSAHGLWMRVLSGAPRPVHELAPDAEPELVAICERAMARETDARYAGVNALAEDLRAWLEGRVVHAYESGALAELKKWVKRNKALAASIAAAVGIAIAGSGGIAVVQAMHTRDLRMSADESLPDYLTAEDERMWPALPPKIPQLQAWLDAAEGLLQREDRHRAQAARLGPPGNESDLIQAAKLGRLLAFCDDLKRPETGGVARVERRLEFARTVRERSVSGDEAATLWSEAIASISDPTRSPKYAGLQIRPQLGLVPLGQDRTTGLWEFAHLASGSVPERDPATGELHIDEESALVFVLLPGGAFWMGSQNDDRSRPNFDPMSTGKEWPLHEVTLDPFFMSKYEMSQAQWRHVTGKTPSYFGENWTPVGGTEPAPITLMHPVEQVSWDECEQELMRLALVIPTEAQWEYAARAGTQTPWWTGAERETLRGNANLADRSAREAQFDWGRNLDWPDDSDGFPVHAPVGSFPANPFGLHDTAGNVWEWTRDEEAVYDTPVRAGDGALPVTGASTRIVRGGCFTQLAPSQRSAIRGDGDRGNRVYVIGLRPSRALE